MSDDTIKKNISKNISKYREAAGISQKDLAKKLGVVPSRISNWETGANCPTIDILFEVCEILNVSINDIYGVYPDSKFILKYGEQDLLKKYRNLDDHGKELVNFTLDKETERIECYGKLGEASRPVTAFPMRLISYYFKNASAGTGQLVIDNLPDKDIEIPDKPEYRNVSYAIGVNGSSMEPAFQDGDILLVEATQEIEVGDIGIFQINNECFVKKLGEKELISLNKDYKNIPLDETAATLGKVIGKL